MSAERLAAWASGIVVAAAVAAGLIVAGSPVSERHARLDERRVADLRQLAAAVDAYWTDHQRLPADLDELVDGLHLSRLPADPVTGADYVYQVSGARRFRLCARFDRPDASAEPDDFWSHDSGRQCFTLQLRGAASTPAPRADAPAADDAGGSVRRSAAPR